MARTGVTTTCSITRPFGGALLYSGIACVVYDDVGCGRGSGLSGILLWSHYMDVAYTVDVIDGCTRFGGSDGLVYSDGDQINLPSGGTWKGVVVFVSEWVDDATSTKYKRVYMLRDTAGTY